jgi:hypothetical protein
MLNLADWVSKDTVPLRIDKAMTVTPLVRMSSDRKRFAAVLLNTSTDATGEFDVRIRVKSRAARLITRKGAVMLPTERHDHEMTVRLPSIPPWHASVLVGQ